MLGLHGYVVAATGICAGISVVLSAALIQQHMTHFSKPLVQSKIVGILWMVPIYCFDSWLSLSFKDYALFLDMFRDCYEAYVLYLFLALLVSYLGDGDEQKVVELLEQQPRIKHMLPFKLCLRGEVPHGAEFLKFCKFGTMQYIVLKPTFTLLAIILSASGLYGEGTFALNRGWVYQVIVMNISVGYAFYCLGLFYILLHNALEQHNPVPKFLCIKAVLFLSFWQGVIIAGIVRLGWLPHLGDWTTQNVALAIQDVLICFEMTLVAFAHRYAFPYEPYVGAPALRTSLLEDHFAHYTAVRDFNEVMPVLLPGNFKPGLAHSIERLPDGSIASAPQQHHLLMEGGLLKRLGVHYYDSGIEFVGGEEGGGRGGHELKEEGGAPLLNKDLAWSSSNNGEGKGSMSSSPTASTSAALEKHEALSLQQLPWRL